jgi:hypothetical protein
VEEFPQIWLYDLGLSKDVRKSAMLNDIQRTEFHQTSQILRMEDFSEKIDE